MTVVTTLLDLVGAALLVVFAWLVWPPAALAVAGGALLLASWRMSTTAGASEEPE